MFYSQIIQYNRYASLSNENSIKIIPIKATRGMIFDRNNSILAQNKLTYSLELNHHNKINLDNLVERLASIITISQKDLKDYRQRTNDYLYSSSSPIKFNLTDKEVAKLLAHKYKFPDIIIKEGFVRDYPQGSTSAHVIGYINRINKADVKKIKKNRLQEEYAGSTHIGKSGVELFYEKLIRGTPGYKKVEVNANQDVVRVIEQVNPINGKDISLTIDMELQKISEKEFNGRRGALVAIDPNNGEILAYVSQPGFNPGLFINGISHRDWKRLNDQISRPLLDRVIGGLYPPGSTLKPFVAFAAVKNDVRVPPFTIEDYGSFTMPNGSKIFKDWKRGGHGTVDLIKALAVSCDTFFYGLGIELGTAKLNEILKLFGFGNKTNIDMHHEKSGLVADKEWKYKKYKTPWYQGETAITAIGQGFTTVTPIQLAMATAKLSKPDNIIKPHVLLKINDKASAPLIQVNKQLSQKNIKSFELVKKGMQKATEEEGTAAFIGRGSAYKIAAKTGTAQVFSLKAGEIYDEETLPEKLRDHALFIAYAPTNNPKIVITVIVENGGHGGSVAGPIAKKVLDFYLRNEIYD